MTATMNSSALILGLGDSGLAAARLARTDGLLLKICDRRKAGDLQEKIAQLPQGTDCHFGSEENSLLDGVDLLILSPGVPSDHPLVQEARRRGLDILGELEFAWKHRMDSPLAAVTGSNGKSTVTTLIAKMLEESGIPTAAGGNLGPPASELVLRENWTSWVLEVSSFQAETFVGFRPQVGVLLNLSQDHLERHPGFEAYLEAKARLFAHQHPEDLAVLNADDPRVAQLPTPGRSAFFSLKKDAEACLEGESLLLEGKELISSGELRIRGRHNIANALAAALAARELGASFEGIAAALRSFEGLPHRHQPVWESGGITWINDSKATNVGSTLSAIQAYPENSVHLILGGLDKNQDFSILREAVSSRVCRLYLIGRDAARIADALKGCAPLEDCGDLGEAVRRAREAARPGEWVILAPGCASYDQFSGYPERGDVFAALARTEGVS